MSGARGHLGKNEKIMGPCLWKKEGVAAETISRRGQMQNRLAVRFERHEGNREKAVSFARSSLTST